MSISSKKILPATYQPKDIEWYTFVPYTYVDGLEKRVIFRDFTFDSDDNIYLAGGYFTDADPLIATEIRSDGLAIIKLDSSRSIVWKKFIALDGSEVSSIQYMKPFNSQECVILGLSYFTSMDGDSCISLDTSNGSIIDQIKIAETTYNGAFEIYDMIPHPAATDNNVLMCVGQQYNATRNQDVSCSGSVGLTSTGEFTISGFSYRHSYYINDAYEQGYHRICYDSQFNLFRTVGRTSASSFFETYGSGSAASTNSTMTYSAAFRHSDYTNGAGMSDVVADSNGNQYYGHCDGTITKVSASNGIITTAAWRVRCNSSSSSKSPVCLALTQSGDFLYVANNRNSIIKYSTSDGSLVSEMVIPTPSMGKQIYSERFRDQSGFKSIEIRSGLIYLTLNYPVKSWGTHGSLLIIPESKFGSSEFKIENGVALINADNVVTPSTLSTTAPAISVMSNTLQAQTVIDESNTISDLDLIFNSETHNEAVPVIIYGLNNGASGSGSTGQFIKNLMSQMSYSYYTLSAKQNDVVFFDFCYAGTGLGTLYTATSGYTLVRNFLANDTYQTSATLQYKRMGATPDTIISVPYSQDATRGNTYRITILRGLKTTDQPYTSSVSRAISNTFNPNLAAISISDTSLVLTWAYNSTNNAYIGAASADSWTTYSTGYTEGVRGSDTYDASAYLAATYIPSAVNFYPNPMQGYPTDNSTYSAGTITVNFQQSTWAS